MAELAQLDVATRYARAVASGREAACLWVKLAAQRHLDDLAHGAERGLWFDHEAVEDARLFYEGLQHSKGEWANQPIALEDWQLFIVGSLLGWKRADGTRRFRVAYIELGRKNGKSTIAAGLGVYLAFADGEAGAEVYSAATKRDQAKVVWLEATRMVRKARRLAQRVTILVNNMHEHASASKFEPLGADADSLDGLNIHGALIDELHAHRHRYLYDVMETGMGSRRQPLLFAITTAGYNMAGVCYEQRIYLQKILQGVVEADDVFGIIYTLDDDDDWRDENVWAKANPNLGVSVKRDELRSEAKRAIEIPSARTAFLTKRMSVWVNAGTAEVDMLAWARCGEDQPVPLSDLAGYPCWIGVDLASKSDLAAVVAVFRRPSDQHIFVKTRFYLPRASVDESAHAATAHYAGWAASGDLTLTDGDLIDFAVIRNDILAFAKRVSLKRVCFDPFNATHLQTELQALGLAKDVVIEIPQTVLQLSGPMYAVRDVLKARKLTHDGNKVMTWCMSNVESKENAHGDLFPRKAAPKLKIDGYTALLNALNQVFVAPAKTPQPRITVIG